MALAFLIKFTIGFVLIATIFTSYEYLFRGSRILLRDEKIELFPFSLKKIISRKFPNAKYAYNINKTKKVAIYGIYLSGQLFVFLLVFISIYLFITI
jgi:hypothetical protein